MNIMLWSWCLAISCGVVFTVGMGGVPSLELGQLSARVEKGKEEISRLQQRAMLPRGTCWKSALENLEVSCRGMIPEHQSRLAFQFSTCYNEMLGFPSVICEKSTPISECVQKLDANSQATFREFFLHTQDMCYFIEHQLWQEKTSNAVNDVTYAVIDVTKNLEEAKETQEKVLHSQQESLKVQSNIIKDNSEIYNMVLNVKDVFQDVQASAVEQRQVVIEVFEKLTRMQKLVSWIQGEMSLLDMLGFYFACILFGFFGTSSRRTQNARFWIVLLCIITLGSERYLYNYLNSSTDYSPDVIQEYVWILRRVMVVVGVLIIVCTAAWYRDPEMVQRNMLTLVNDRLGKLSAQVEYMQGFMDTSLGSMLAIDGIPSGNGDLDDSDSDTFSDYSVDSDISNQSEANRLPEEEEETESNDENQVPETNPETTNSLYSAIRNRLVGDRTRQLSAGTTNDSKHGYNLRQRVASPNTSFASIQDESSTQFARRVKHPRRNGLLSVSNHASNCFSSDEEI